MSVTFVIGRAGSGKTQRCFERVVAALRESPLNGPPILWIVPRQATFTTERELTCGSGLGAFSRARILSFEKLVIETHAACGGTTTPEVTPLGRQMILGHLLRQNQGRLQFFNSVARQPGVAIELDAAFDEMERSGLSNDDIGAILQEKHPFLGNEADPQALLAKLHDLHLLYSAYSTFLGQDRLDPARRLKVVLECIQNDRLFHGADVFVDGFLDYTDNERRILGALAKSARSLEITVLADPTDDIFANTDHHPGELELFRRTGEAFRRLWFTFKEDRTPVNPLVKLNGCRAKSETLRHIEASLFTPASRGCTGGDNLEMIVAPDPPSEVDAAARRILELTDRGFRLRDIWVLVRTLEQYDSLIEPSFREHGIPFFIDRRLTAGHHPLLMFIRAAISIARHDWPHDAVMALLKTGLASCTNDEADDLENYVLRHRLKGGAAWEAKAPWNYRRSSNRDDPCAVQPADDPAQRMESLRRQVWFNCAPLITVARSNHAIPLTEFAKAVFETLTKFNVSRALGSWISAAERTGDPQQQAEHQQVWSQLVSLFDEMNDLLGDEPMDFDAFVDVLESGLERFSLGVTPPQVDQVLIGQIDRTRAGRPRAVIVMGLNERQFPHVPQEGCILSDAERKTLRRQKFDLGPDCRGKLLDERLLAYIAFTRASERLIVTRCLSADAKGATEPSAYWRELSRLVPAASHQLVPIPGLAELKQVSTPRQALTGVMQWIRSRSVAQPDGDDEQSQAWRSIYQWVATLPPSDGPLEKLRHRCWRAVNYQNAAALSADIAAQLFEPPLKVTARQLETFAACPFQHFVRHGLRLEARESATVTGIDLSEICHRALDRLISDVLAQQRDWLGDPPPILAKDIERCAGEIGRTLRGEIMLDSARSRYLQQRVHQAIDDVLLAQMEIMKRSDFRPARASVRFGDAANDVAALSVSTPGGAKVSVRGKVDRVDRSLDGRHLLVLDYRLSVPQLVLQEVFHGLSLQLLTGLIALHDAAAQESPETAAAGALMLQIFRRFRNVKHPRVADNPDDPASRIFARSRGIFDGSLLQSLDRELVNGRSRVVNAFLRKDGELGRGASDAALRSEFDAITAFVRRRLGELAGGVLEGHVEIRPYQLSNASPCSECGLQSICRFERSVNRYRILESFGRNIAIEKMMGVEQGVDDDAR